MFLGRFFLAPSNHDVLLVVAQLLLFFWLLLEEFSRQCLALNGLYALIYCALLLGQDMQNKPKGSLCAVCCVVKLK